MSSDHVLRIVRTDVPGEYILLNTSSNGSSPLDLQILATEGTEPYKKALKHARISKYRAKSNHLSEPQWETLLRSTLLQENTPDQQDPDVKDFEIVASISNSKLTVTFRKSISGIHLKLGELSLSKIADAGINVLDWANTAILRAESLEAEAHTLQHKLAEQTGFAQKLNLQLEELIQAKKEHEDTFLQKCALLINEKKGKIRDQYRLLATAKVDPKKLRAVQAARRPGSPSRQSSGPSAKGKRKASALASSDDGEDDGFEDQRIKAEEVEEEQQPDSEDVTPEHSDLDETEDEVDGAEFDSVPVPSTGEGKVTEKPEVAGGASRSGVLNGARDVDLPPRREPPFMKDKPEPSQRTNILNTDQDTKMADDDETDDDEL
ncbi:MAG: hypothetical protein L6R42_004924 [Xanthoria sp. 1 TBL-2021]|nr:MAG: hypothetical protein L6R42_004924 [Xanthoria sp. 1 TBL-2021]